MEQIGVVDSNDKPVELDLFGDVGDALGSFQAVECQGDIDWDGLQIEETVDEEGEGVLDVKIEDWLFCLLGLRTDDDQRNRSSEADA